MMLTEEQAKKKWCPHARATDMGDIPLSVNRRGNAADPDCLCIASACMAWRLARQIDGNIGRGFCGAFGPAVQQ